MLSCEYYEIFMNTYFEEHLRTAKLTAQSTNLFGRLLRIHKNNYVEVMVFATCYDSHFSCMRFLENTIKFRKLIGT